MANVLFAMEHYEKYARKNLQSLGLISWDITFIFLNSLATFMFILKHNKFFKLYKKIYRYDSKIMRNNSELQNKQSKRRIRMRTLSSLLAVIQYIFFTFYGETAMSALRTTVWVAHGAYSETFGILLEHIFCCHALMYRSIVSTCEHCSMELKIVRGDNEDYHITPIRCVRCFALMQKVPYGRNELINFPQPLSRKSVLIYYAQTEAKIMYVDDCVKLTMDIFSYVLLCTVLWISLCSTAALYFTIKAKTLVQAMANLMDFAFMMPKFLFLVTLSNECNQEVSSPFQLCHVIKRYVHLSSYVM